MEPPISKVAGLGSFSPMQMGLGSSMHFSFNNSNNMAEHKALVAGLSMAKELDVQQLRAFTDSQLITSHI